MTPPQSDQHAGQSEAERLAFILNHVGAYVFAKDLDGRYTYANDMVLQLFGLPREQVLGQSDERFFDLNVSDALRQHDRRVMENGERIEREERNIIQSSGEERVYWSVKLPIRDPDGAIIGLCGVSTDITERRRAEEALAQQKALLNTVLENIDGYVYMKDAQRRYLYVNSKTAALYQKTPEQIIGKLDEELLSPQVAAEFARLDNIVLQLGKKTAGEESIAEADGITRHYWSIKLPLLEGDAIEGLIGISTDITEVVTLKNKFHDMARLDALTGALSRAFFLEKAETALKAAQRRHNTLALAVIDLDHFKQINDAHGHQFGDRYLTTAASAFQNALREGDFLGRMGGDEFLIIIQDANATQMARSLSRIHAALSRITLTAPNGEELRISASIGAALSWSDCDIDALTAHADAALYRAKAAGRNCWRAYDAAEDARLDG
ncbi:PAS domain-containing protein [Magnetofaba australis]|uniref:Putative PAS/PAC sensor-containing diguanylate cyclase n=1 Tax=Magnetofaba australis IT-1 TaxID=1434232 RepID=A0A1Y2JYZ4_9PROT|nr:PAS domain-containing protein [Magnetofaba australis]OSM00106.1 putative PAS/PAC sensor-containing diguanylate cyclase [Magnetofaba australis IT-1]